jgi:hypothetical protein
MNTRICSTCGMELPLTSEFWHKDNHNKYGFRLACKECIGNKRRKHPKKKIAQDGFKVCTKCGNEYPATYEYFHKDSSTKDTLYPSCKACMNKTPISQKEGFKICIRCLQELPKSREYFSKNRSSSDGYLGYCKVCQGRSFEPKQKYLPISPKEGYKICSTCGTALLLNEDNFNISKQSKDGFTNVCKACRKVRLQANKEEINQKYRLYRKKNKVAFNIRKQRRNTAKKNLIADFSIEDWNNCLEHFNYSCAYCGEKSDSLQQEHFIPVAMNGNYTRNNILPACHRCNTSKRDRNFFKWYPKQKFYNKVREAKILDYLCIEDSCNCTETGANA